MDDYMDLAMEQLESGFVPSACAWDRQCDLRFGIDGGDGCGADGLSLPLYGLPGWQDEIGPSGMDASVYGRAIKMEPIKRESPDPCDGHGPCAEEGRLIEVTSMRVKKEEDEEDEEAGSSAKKGYCVNGFGHDDPWGFATLGEDCDNIIACGSGESLLDCIDLAYPLPPGWMDLATAKDEKEEKEEAKEIDDIGPPGDDSMQGYESAPPPLGLQFGGHTGSPERAHHSLDPETGIKRKRGPDDTPERPEDGGISPDNSATRGTLEGGEGNPYRVAQDTPYAKRRRVAARKPTRCEKALLEAHRARQLKGERLDSETLCLAASMGWTVEAIRVWMRSRDRSNARPTGRKRGRPRKDAGSVGGKGDGKRSLRQGAETREGSPKSVRRRPPVLDVASVSPEAEAEANPAEVHVPPKAPVRMVKVGLDALKVITPFGVQTRRTGVSWASMRLTPCEPQTISVGGWAWRIEGSDAEKRRRAQLASDATARDPLRAHSRVGKRKTERRGSDG